MKQHITIEQWNELPPSGQVKIRKLWRNNGQEVNLLGVNDINIGQMIEFLDEQNENFDVIYRYKGGWEVGSKDHNDILAFSDKEELCDALWEAVKEVLNK